MNTPENPPEPCEDHCYQPPGTMAAIPYKTLPGWVCAFVAIASKPSPEECRAMLVKMRTSAHLSRGKLAALLGVQIDTLRRWEEGVRTPSSAARRLIQLVNLLYFHPDRMGAALVGGDVMLALFCEQGIFQRTAAVRVD